MGLLSLLRHCLVHWPALSGLPPTTPTPVTKPRVPLVLGRLLQNPTCPWQFPLSSYLTGIRGVLGPALPRQLESAGPSALYSQPSLQLGTSTQSNHSTGQRTGQPWFCSQICSCPAVVPQASPSLHCKSGRHVVLMLPSTLAPQAGSRRVLLSCQGTCQAREEKPSGCSAPADNPPSLKANANYFAP